MPNITVSSTGYTIAFWFYAYNYIPSNISNFNIKWDLQLKINISSDQKGIKVTCFPAYDSTVPTSYTLLQSTLYYPNYKWGYFRCSADRVTKDYVLMSDTLMNAPVKVFDSFPTISVGTTNLIFEDLSTDSWGALYISQIRLWNCSYCISPGLFRFKFASVDFVNYPNLKHLIDPIFNTNYKIQDEINSATIFINAIKKSIFGTYPIDENIYSLNNLLTLTADNYNVLPKVSDFNDFKFSNLPVSYWGKYTMEFWFMVQNLSNFVQGLNVIYSQHLAISLITDYSNKNNLNIVCFPTEFKTSPSGKSGSDLTNFIMLD